MIRPTPAHVALGFIAVVAVAFTAIAATGAILPGELVFARWIQDTPGGLTLEPLADAVAWKPLQGTVVVVFAAIAWRAGHRALAMSAVLVFVALAANPAMKEMIGRARPTADDLAIREPARALGFPSGHSSSAVLLYGYVIVAAWQSLRRPLATGVVVLAAALVLVIGWDRVWDGAHWPSDVVGGLSIGALLLALSLWLPQQARALSRRAAAQPTPARREVVGQADG
jgi:membrane-associated phospholipid phosphatase